MKRQGNKRRAKAEYGGRRERYKHGAPPPRRSDDDGPEGPRSFAAGQIEQDYGESRRESPDIKDDDGLPAQKRKPRHERHDADMAIGQESDTNS